MQVVAPKKEKLAEAEAEVAGLMATLRAKQDELAAVLAEVQDLKDTLTNYTNEKISLAEQVPTRSGVRIILRKNYLISA